MKVNWCMEAHRALLCHRPPGACVTIDCLRNGDNHPSCLELPKACVSPETSCSSWRQGFPCVPAAVHTTIPSSSIVANTEQQETRRRKRYELRQVKSEWPEVPETDAGKTKNCSKSHSRNSAVQCLPVRSTSSSTASSPNRV